MLAILLSGICLIAPDGAILAGQYSLLALLLVVVMIAVRVIAQPESARRVFSTSSSGAGKAAATFFPQSSRVTQTLELVESGDDSQDGVVQ